MFLRRYHRTKDGKTHTYYALVESVRTEAGPRQRVVAYLGELNHDEERRWQRTVVFHNRQGDGRQLRLFPDDEHVDLPDDPDVVRISLKSVGWANPRPFGDVWLGLWLWRHLKLDEIVERHIPRGKETISPYAHRAVNSPWRNTGTLLPASKTFWASPIAPSPKIVYTGHWTVC